MDIVGKVIMPCLNKNNNVPIEWLVMDQLMPYAILRRPGLDKLCHGWRSTLLRTFTINHFGSYCKEPRCRR